MTSPPTPLARSELIKIPTGIRGFDEITGGGRPRGRPTLVCGSAGCGKTLFGIEFIVRGATEHGEPGVFVSFEENADELTQNVASLGFDLPNLVAQGKLAVDHVRVERSEIEETGEYDLEGLFVRLGFAIDTIGARRVVLDTIEALFASLPNEGILRAELRRLFRWLKDKKVTGERGDGSLTRRGLEEYVSDCVILLDQRLHEQVATRRLRVVKYRGSPHGTNEYPFLIHEGGIAVLPVTSAGLRHQASSERVSIGIPRLDGMLGGLGLYRGSSVLISGTAGSGKTSLAAHTVAAACARGERCPCSSTRSSRRGIRSSPSPRWSASCPSRCARSSETSPTPSVCWSASIYGSARKRERTAPYGDAGANGRVIRGRAPSRGSIRQDRAAPLRRRRRAALDVGHPERAAALRAAPRRSL